MRPSPQTLGCTISVLISKDQLQSKEQHAHLYAEMQIVNFMRQSGLKLGVVAISMVTCRDILGSCGIDGVHNENGHLIFPEGPIKC